LTVQNRCQRLLSALRIQVQNNRRNKMPIPGTARDKFLSEVANADKPEFLQEIKEPSHEEELVEEKPKKKKTKAKKKK